MANTENKKESLKSSMLSRKFLLCLLAMLLVCLMARRNPSPEWGWVLIGILAQYGWFNVADKKVPVPKSKKDMQNILSEADSSLTEDKEA